MATKYEGLKARLNVMRNLNPYHPWRHGDKFMEIFIDIRRAFYAGEITKEQYAELADEWCEI